jgi:hypothetical protein
MRTFLLFLLINLLSVNIFAGGKFDETPGKLTLRVKVLEATLDRTDENFPSVDLKIEATFTNEGDEPVIMLLPAKDLSAFGDLISLTGISIMGKNENGNYPIKSCNEKLGKLLDQKQPPENHTKILAPKASVALTDNFAFRLPLKTSSGGYGWDEIEKNGWKVEGMITYSMFPVNLGKYGDSFDRKLQKRWRTYGVLFAGNSNGSLASEKFEIDLTGLKF